ncbi:cilia- and flagella-associated protein 91-like [Vespula maculifrons]|uniref:Cilia- and flagella-associated protein 91 n=1 Tax=Vespula maculifrons TaxID=7453 RepID=A0ABD2B4M5_VESMC
MVVFLIDTFYLTYNVNYRAMATQCKPIELITQEKCKHFQRSTSTAFQYFPTTQNKNIRYDTEILDTVLKNMKQQYCISMLQSKLFKNVETQTDYRESETQTVPWEPQYKIHPGHNPEVLTVTHLTWDHGLPAGMHEIEIINRTKMKRTWEMFLPPMDTKANIKIRRCITKALEEEQWAFRDAEIQYIMDLRLQLMEKLTHSKECKYNENMQNRFKRLKNDLGMYRDEKIKVIRQNLKRDLRKLHKLHYDKKQLQKRDTIQSYINHASKLYRSQLNFEKYSPEQYRKMKKQSCRNDNINHEKIQSIDAISTKLPSYKEPKSKIVSPTELCIRQTRWTDDKLKALYMDLKAMRLNIIPPETSTLMKKKYKVPVLPSTPYRVQERKDTSIDQAALYIQETIRGRATQCMLISIESVEINVFNLFFIDTQQIMFEGRNRCRELIKELQFAYDIMDHNNEVQQIEKQEIIDIQQKQRNKLLQEEILCEIFDSLEGATVCGILDHLSKELIRLKDERNAHMFALFAERERLKREAAEAGRRQLELNRRRECDEMFRQIIKVDQGSVEIYLDDVIKEEIEEISYQNAEQHILQFFDHVDEISNNTIGNMTDLAEEEMIADMIYNFVLPEVGKFNAREQIKKKQQSYLQSAHAILYENSSDSLPVEPISSENSEEVHKESLFQEDSGENVQ